MKISLKNKLEAILFLENEPILINELAKRLDEKQKNCEKELKNLKDNYKKNESALDLIIANKKVQLVAKKDLADFLKEYFQKQSQVDQISPAMLEVLSIILYKGSIGKAGIEQIRGVNCGLILRKLLIRGFINREEQVEDSRIFIYKPSFKLLKKLGISQLEELPDYDKLSKELS